VKRWQLPVSGWKGYGSPGFVTQAARDLRAAAVEADMTTGHEIREMAFGRWQRDFACTNASIPLWIAACGMKR
jgi:hypothetical protein